MIRSAMIGSTVTPSHSREQLKPPTTSSNERPNRSPAPPLSQRYNIGKSNPRRKKSSGSATIGSAVTTSDSHEQLKPPTTTPYIPPEDDPIARQRRREAKRRASLYRLLLKYKSPALSDASKFKVKKPPEYRKVDGKIWYKREPPDCVEPEHECTPGRCLNAIRINVCGHHFDMCIKYLNGHEDTLLGDKARRSEYWDGWRQEFFFDRHRLVFGPVFDFYRFGTPVARPEEVPMDVFVDELKFYGLECPDSLGSEDDLLKHVTEGSWLWKTFEEPRYSWAALVINLTSVIATCITIVALCLETVPAITESMPEACVDGHFNYLDTFFLIETVCTAWFSGEFILRFACCPKKFDFIKNTLNICDFLAIIPYYIVLSITLITSDCSTAEKNMVLGFLRVLRVIRVFKLAKHARPLQVLLKTFVDSAHMLKTFLLTLCISVLVFSHVFLTFEPNITYLYDAGWYALISMTTVGYGDITPETTAGKIAGMCCVLAGVLTISLPIPVLSENFQKYYSRK